MNKRLILFLAVCGFITNALGQKSLSDYTYVEVPKLYEFLFEEDQHQLNSLTKFLFNKYGFNAYFSDELPNVKRCDGLQAEILGKPGFIYTKITVVLKDCNGTEVFRSEEGKSKYKEYKKAYHDAMRKAFVSVEELGVQQKEVTVYEDDANEDASEAPVVQPDKKAEEKTGDDTGASEVANTMYFPEAKFTSYEKDGASFLLRKTVDGYSLYEESETAPNGLLLKGNILVAPNVPAIYQSADGKEMEVSFSKNNDLYLGSSVDRVIFKAQN